MLINIIRTRKRENFVNKLENHKNDTKVIWSIRNSIIKNKIRDNKYPQFIMENEHNQRHEWGAKRFNTFLVNIGPKLAQSIIVKGTETNILDYTERNRNSVFLKVVEEK